MQIGKTIKESRRDATRNFFFSKKDSRGEILKSNQIKCLPFYGQAATVYEENLLKSNIS